MKAWRGKEYIIQASTVSILHRNKPDVHGSREKSTRAEKCLRIVQKVDITFISTRRSQVALVQMPRIHDLDNGFAQNHL